MNSSLRCKLCNDFFDTNSKVPRLLPRCGHSVCEECLRAFLGKGVVGLCPEDGEVFGDDRKSITHFPVNATFFDLLDSKGKPPVRNIVVPINNSMSSESKANLLNESGSDFQIYRSSDEKANPGPAKRADPKESRPSTGSLTDGGFCETHQKKKKTVCLDDECLKLICSHCGLYGAHRVG